MKKLTQTQRVEKRLVEVGYITRNQCLSVYPAITRLSAIIQVLEEKGFEFEAKDVKGDYVYKLIKTPYRRLTRTLANGEVITTLQK